METNVTGMCGECSQCLGHTGFAPAHSMCAFPVYTAQAPDCSQGNCLWWALGCMHFPGLSRSGSGSRVLHKDTDSVRPAFCALPRSEQLRDQVLGERTLPRWVVRLITFPIPATRFPGCTVGALSQVCHVSFGALISVCETPGGCQPSRIPGRLG